MSKKLVTAIKAEVVSTHNAYQLYRAARKGWKISTNRNSSYSIKDPKPKTETKV